MEKDLEVVKLLNKLNIKHRIIRLKDRAVSAKDVIKHSLGDVDFDEIFKTIIVIDKNGKKYALLINHKRMLDFSKVRDIVGSKVRLANEEELKGEGFEPGTVCPVLVKVPLFVDKELFKFKKFNCGSGDLNYGLEINVEDLKKVKMYTIVDVKK